MGLPLFSPLLFLLLLCLAALSFLLVYCRATAELCYCKASQAPHHWCFAYLSHRPAWSAVQIWSISADKIIHFSSHFHKFHNLTNFRRRNKKPQIFITYPYPYFSKNIGTTSKITLDFTKLKNFFSFCSFFFKILNFQKQKRGAVAERLIVVSTNDQI